MDREQYEADAREAVVTDIAIGVSIFLVFGGPSLILWLSGFNGFWPWAFTFLAGFGAGIVVLGIMTYVAAIRTLAREKKDVSKV